MTFKIISMKYHLITNLVELPKQNEAELIEIFTSSEQNKALKSLDEEFYKEIFDKKSLKDNKV